MNNYSFSVKAFLTITGGILFFIGFLFLGNFLCQDWNFNMGASFISSMFCLWLIHRVLENEEKASKEEHFKKMKGIVVKNLENAIANAKEKSEETEDYSLEWYHYFFMHGSYLCLWVCGFIGVGYLFINYLFPGLSYIFSFLIFQN